VLLSGRSLSAPGQNIAGFARIANAVSFRIAHFICRICNGLPVSLRTAVAETAGVEPQLHNGGPFSPLNETSPHCTFKDQMLDRRRHPRSALTDALPGTLRLVEDVLVESFGSTEMTVVSGVPARSDQCLAITPLGGAPPSALDVQVTESTPAVVDGVLKHRLRLRVISERHAERPRLLGALIRQVPVRLMDVSAGGCLLESNVPVGHGTGGELHVALDGEQTSDGLRVCRCQLVRGAGSVFRLGAEFTPSRNGRSLRELVERSFGQGVVGESALPF